MIDHIVTYIKLDKLYFGECIHIQVHYINCIWQYRCNQNECILTDDSQKLKKMICILDYM